MLKIAGIAFCGTVAYILLKEYKPEYAIFGEICTAAVVFVSVIDEIIGLKAGLSGFLVSAGIDNGYLSILLKALGTALLTEFSSNTARDSGQTALAAEIEFAGRAVILYCALPLLKGIIGIIGELAENM